MLVANDKQQAGPCSMQPMQALLAVDPALIHRHPLLNTYTPASTINTWSTPPALETFFSFLSPPPSTHSPRVAKPFAGAVSPSSAEIAPPGPRQSFCAFPFLSLFSPFGRSFISSLSSKPQKLQQLSNSDPLCLSLFAAFFVIPHVSRPVPNRRFSSSSDRSNPTAGNHHVQAFVSFPRRR